MKHPVRGFTLIELMTAILVGSVLLAVAIPSFREMIRNNRVASAQNDVVTALTVARSEALHRSMPVSVCASTDGSSCSGGTNWASGWIAFTDGTGTSGAIDGTDTVLQKWAPSSTDLTITGSVAFVRYAMTGMLASVAPQNIQVYTPSCVGPKLRRVDISAVGSLTATTQNCP